MIMVRIVFQTQWSTTNEVVAAMAEGLRRGSETHEHKMKLLTDLSGEFHTVVLEAQFEEPDRMGAVPAPAVQQPRIPAQPAGSVDGLRAAGVLHRRSRVLAGRARRQRRAVGITRLCLEWRRHTMAAPTNSIPRPANWPQTGAENPAAQVPLEGGGLLHDTPAGG
jgi:hypothetical protein